MPPDKPNDEMLDYLQMFMDETEEQLDGLVDALLVLEDDADDVEALNDAFRLIHSIKGSAGMMGFESIGLLTHHLESRFELFRSRTEILDQPTMNLVLRCIDFLRECVRRMRAGEELGSIGPLLEELRALEVRDPPATEPEQPVDPTAPTAPIAAAAPAATVEEGQLHLVVHFEPDLPLVDLKARLIHARVSKLADVVATTPAMEAIESIDSLTRLDLVLVTEATPDELRAAADADGIQFVDVVQPGGVPEPATTESPAPEPPVLVAPTSASADTTRVPDAVVEEGPPASAEELATPAEPMTAVEVPAASVVPAPEKRPVSVPRRASVETMRVDVERLDNLMNLAGELVVNRARFVQISDRVTPALRSRNAITRANDFTDNLRRTISRLEQMSGGNGDMGAHIAGLVEGLDLMEEQAELWETGRRSFVEIGEAIDQLTRVSDSLQRSVLGTRMVPVAPLFNRFKRVVRDLSTERGKQVDLEIRGEKTELDKRMIDELGDPLVHLVRNSIDHGLEAPEVRAARGKAEVGTIRLEARHSGNSVFIEISDDGGGIDVERIRTKLVARGLASRESADQLTDAKVLEHIWHPGFSTAEAVTDISGRGVGMDAVRTRITELNGSIEVDTTPAVGTRFTLRLPLTLAIIHSLLIRIRGVIFAMPIEDVREIVALSPADVVSVHGRETVDVRGEFLPLASIDDVFCWNEFGRTDAAGGATNGDGELRAVVLQTGGKTLALRVDALVGSDDLVIKSISQNFIPIPGLAGASILGDGSVCLMLDVAGVIDRAVRAAGRTAAR